MAEDRSPGASTADQFGHASSVASAAEQFVQEKHASRLNAALSSLALHEANSWPSLDTSKVTVQVFSAEKGVTMHSVGHVKRGGELLSVPLDLCIKSTEFEDTEVPTCFSDEENVVDFKLVAVLVDALQNNDPRACYEQHVASLETLRPSMMVLWVRGFPVQ
jgi:hypothetical protein